MNTKNFNNVSLFEVARIIIFRGRTDRHLRGILPIFRDRRVLQTYLRTTTIRP
jgi:hypothetical protein